MKRIALLAFGIFSFDLFGIGQILDELNGIDTVKLNRAGPNAQKVANDFRTVLTTLMSDEQMLSRQMSGGQITNLRTQVQLFRRFINGLQPRATVKLWDLEMYVNFLRPFLNPQPVRPPRAVMPVIPTPPTVAEPVVVPEEEAVVVPGENAIDESAEIEAYMEDLPVTLSLLVGRVPEELQRLVNDFYDNPIGFNRNILDEHISMALEEQEVIAQERALQDIAGERTARIFDELRIDAIPEGLIPFIDERIATEEFKQALNDYRQPADGNSIFQYRPENIISVAQTLRPRIIDDVQRQLVEAIQMVEGIINGGQDSGEIYYEAVENLCRVLALGCEFSGISRGEVLHLLSRLRGI